MAECAVHSLCDYLMQLMNSNRQFVLDLYEQKLIEKDQFEWLYREMQFLGAFLKDSEEQFTEHKQVKKVVTKIIKLTYGIEDFIDWLVLENVLEAYGVLPDDIRDAIEESGVLWLRKFITGTPRKEKIVVQKIESLMAKKTSLSKKMKSVSEEIESDHGEEIICPEEMKNIWEEIESDHAKGVIRQQKMKNASEDIESDRADGMILQEKMKNVLEDTMSDHADGIICQDFGSICKEIESIKTEVMEIYEKKKYGIRVSQTEEFSDAAASKNASTQWTGEDAIVGIDDEKTAIMDLLTAEHEKQLRVISIVGMPGLGKTALARLVYNDPLIVYRFDIRAWTHVSQVHCRRDSLVNILRLGFELRDEISQMDDKSLGEELHKRLKGRRYLIVMDDIWNIGAWNELKTYFPNDNNGSRVIFTSRLAVVAGNAKPHYLRFLSEDESWDLLQKKIFRKESCPQELVEIGKQITKKCQGLPLAILVISGPLAKGKKTQMLWKQVAESLRPYDIVSDPEQYMDTLALSYNYLPHHLKPCFLYLGAFPEYYEIHVWKLIWLWAAEGLIRRNEQKSLEEVAEDYFMDLIDRSLVIVSKIGSNGRIKTCYIHDLLRALCLRKAQEVNFLQQISKYQQTCSFSSRPEENNPRRISIHSNNFHYTSFLSKLHIRSLLSFGSSFYGLSKGIPFVWESSKLLRVLDLSSIKIVTIPEGIMQLVLLRYLALQVGPTMEFHLSISNLWNLETLIVEGSKGSLVLSYGAWQAVKLRHLSSKLRTCIKATHYVDNVLKFVNLETLCRLDGPNMNFLRACPNLKRLQYCGSLLKLDFLIHLETLKIDSFWWAGEHGIHLNMFPLTLKCLTLSFMELAWQEMSTLGSLPNLEVLKLLAKAFKGARWDTRDGEFRKLRFLKFQRLGIVQWNASSEHFPNLQTLVLDDCSLLKEIPSSFGDIPTLDMIRLRYCTQSAECSAKQIQEQQQSMGNDGFKILIHSYHGTV